MSSAPRRPEVAGAPQAGSRVRFAHFAQMLFEMEIAAALASIRVSHGADLDQCS
jgi:hypothetical protein